MMEVNVRTVPAQNILSRTQSIPVYKLGFCIQESLNLLWKTVEENHLTQGGPPFGIFHGPITETDTGPLEVCLPILEMPSTENISDELVYKTVPAMQIASVTVEGEASDYPQILSAYDAVCDWVPKNGFAVVAPSREIWHIPVGSLPKDGPIEVALPFGEAEVYESDKSMITKPKIEVRREQHTVGIRTRVPVSELPKIIPTCHKEVFTFLRTKGIAPDGPPFLRFHVIDMKGMMDVEVGVPVVSAISSDNRIMPGVLPAGHYASLIYTGLDGIPGNKVLIDWAQKNHIHWDRWDDPHGDAFRCRLEFYLTDPAREPDMTKWETQVTIKLAGR